MKSGPIATMVLGAALMLVGAVWYFTIPAPASYRTHVLDSSDLICVRLAKKPGTGPVRQWPDADDLAHIPPDFALCNLLRVDLL